MIMVILFVVVVTTTFNEHTDEHNDNDVGGDIDCAVIRYGR